MDFIVRKQKKIITTVFLQGTDADSQIWKLIINFI